MWELEIFSKQTEELIEALPLRTLRGVDVRILLGLPTCEDVYAGGYPVDGDVLDELSRLADRSVRQDADYFLAYTAPRFPVWAVGEEPMVFWRDGALVNLHA
ncbi:hypothetical protein ASE03_30260 [Kitasatospora sp. Root187]|nr:hypothetical protein ASC99_30475 [Kitasatospora sp. Root107]KRB68221.1 hypothetical protein ASE03_30260 [Kitasatospora sp. Root187]